MTTSRGGGGARLALLLGIVAIVLVPASYLWVPFGNRSPEWVRSVVPMAELAAVACGIGAIAIGLRARRIVPADAGAIWGPRLGSAAILLLSVVYFLVAGAIRPGS